MKVFYLSHSEKPVRAVELMTLYEDAGWWAGRKEEGIEHMLKQEPAVDAWKDSRLIGFARAVSDNKFRVYIEDVVVHHDFQKSGIGTNLVSRLLEELSHIDIISLFCEADAISFYERNGFKCSKPQKILHRKQV